MLQKNFREAQKEAAAAAKEATQAQVAFAQGAKQLQKQVAAHRTASLIVICFTV